MASIPLIRLVDFHRLFRVEPFASQLVLVYVRIFEVFVVEVEEPPILLLEHVAQSMESLDILSIQVLQHSITYYHVAKNVAILDNVDLLKCKVVIDQEYFVVDSLLHVGRVDKHPLFHDDLFLLHFLIGQIQLEATREIDIAKGTIFVATGHIIA